MTDILLRPGATSLADWRADLSRRRRDPRSRLLAAGRGERRSGRAHRAQGRAGLWREYRLRQARERSHRRGGPREAATQHRAFACRRRRRADAGSDRPADDGAEAREPGPGGLRRAAGNAGALASDAGARRDARRPRARVCRRLGRSRAAGPHGRGDDRRRRGLFRGSPPAGGSRSRRRRPRAARARPEGGPRAAQRHAILDRLRAGGVVRGGAAVPVGAAERRAIDRCGARVRRAVRSAHPRLARPSRPDRDRGGAAAT